MIIDQGIQNLGVGIVYFALGVMMWLVGRHERRRHLGAWTTAMMCFAGHSLVNAIIKLFDLPAELHAIAWVGLLAGCGFVAYGVQDFVKLRVSRWWWVALAAVVATTAVLLLARVMLDWVRVPVFTYIGAALIGTGLAINRKGPRGAGRAASGLGCAAAGVWAICYPFLARQPWMRYAEFYVDLTFVLWCATGVVLMHFELAREEAASIALQYRSLFEGALTGLFRLDRSGRLLAVNPALLGLLRTDQERALQLDLLGDVLVEDDVRAAVRRALGLWRDVPLCETRWRRTDGDEASVAMAIRVVVGADGTPTHFEGSALDFTAERKLRLRLQQTERLEALGRLAGGVAHDFNNVLAVIVNGTELGLRRAAKHPDVVQPLETVLEAARGATELTRQLLTFGQRRGGTSGVVDLNEGVLGSIRMLRAALERKTHVESRVHRQPLPILAAPGQIEQVLMNLALNARDAMPGGGTLTIATTVIETEDGEQRARLTVTDTGHGMDEATQTRVFEPFFTTKPEGQGTGLGLATVYGIVQQLEGTITVQSQVDVGTTFTMDLPIAAPPPSLRPREVQRVVGGASILLVEDRDLLRSSTRTALTESGYRVLAAANADEARIIIRRESVDLLLTDVMMPGESGPELALDLRRDRPDLPVLFMSGFTDDAPLGAVENSHFIAKPFSIAELSRAISVALMHGPPDNGRA